MQHLLAVVLVLIITSGVGFLFGTPVLHHGQLDTLNVATTSTESNATATITTIATEDSTDAMTVPSDGIGATGTATVTPTVVTESPTPIPEPTPPPEPTPKPTPIPQPEPTEGEGTFMRTVGQREGSFFIQAILTDRVDGLWCQTYPVAREEGEPRTVRVGDDIGYACEGISIKLLYIDSVRGRVTFQKKISNAPMGGCPL